VRDRYLWVIAVSAAAIAALIFAISRIDLGDAIREVTLPLRHDDIIRQQAERHDLDPALIAAVIFEESRFQDQTSHAGARGLMQITPDTADTIERLSGGETFVFEDLANPDLNIRYGTYYLNYLLDLYDGNVVAALAAYNGGPGNVDGWGGSELEVGDIEFAETQNYVEEVLERRDEYEKNYAEELGL
jgi:soluble lytic murein transglycosylase